MKLRLRRLPSTEIPTASMADIAFLLLVFFVVTAVFSSNRGLPVRWPSTGGAATASGPPAFIEVGADGAVRVDCTPTRPGAILEALEHRLRANADTAVVLTVDPAARYQSFVAVYDVLSGGSTPGGLQVRNLAIPTRQEIAAAVAVRGHDPYRPTCP